MTANEQRRTRRIGDLAEAAGMTVRSLHYYEEIGLLVPSERNDAGHRLYDEADVARLYRICLLRRLGLPLNEIGQVLDDPAWDLSTVLAEHLAALEARLSAGARLRSQLTQLLAASPEATEPTTNHLLQVLEDMAMLDSNVRQRISILVYRDIDAAHDHLTTVFGLGPGEITRDGDGTAVHGTVEAGDGVVWLHPESPDFGLASPHTLGSATATMAVMVDDVDAHHAEAAARGADIVYEPTDQPYGYREYGARDCEGGLWSFMKPLEES